jgi:hypothetical protein
VIIIIIFIVIKIVPEYNDIKRTGKKAVLGNACAVGT